MRCGVVLVAIVDSAHERWGVKGVQGGVGRSLPGNRVSHRANCLRLCYAGLSFPLGFEPGKKLDDLRPNHRKLAVLLEVVKLHQVIQVRSIPDNGKSAGVDSC